MSLKAFHMVFIVISVAFTTGFGVWALRVEPNYRVWGVASLVVAAGLLVYGFLFLRKIQREHL